MREQTATRRSVLAGLGGGAALAGLPGVGARRLDVSSDDPLDEIEIRTDEYNVSHVYADDLYSLAYGNGYVQARDRLFQLEVFRLIGKGESASVLGSAQLDSDIQLTRDLYTEAERERMWETASSTTREAVLGFVDGINRKIIERAAEGEMPAEFPALAHAPEPWEPEDVIAVISFQIGVFGVGNHNQLSMARDFQALRESLDDDDAAFEAFEDLHWLETKDDHYTTIPEDELEVDADQTVPESLDAVPDEQLEFAEAATDAEIWGIEEDITLPDSVTDGDRTAHGLLEDFQFGSNALNISGEHTESGRPIMWSGPQMGKFLPPVPYEIGLHGAGYDCVGMGVPGTPTIVVGRTPNISWSVTTGADDMVDVIAVELHPEDRHRYRWDGEWHEMETETVRHVVSPVPSAQGGDPEARVVEQEIARIRQRGDVMPVIAWNEEERVAWCQRTTTRYEELDGAFLWAQVGRQDSIEEFREQMSEFPFSFNMQVTDRENISYHRFGKIPDRNPDNDHRLPAVAEAHEWRSIRQGAGLGLFDENPDQGFYLNWNNGPVSGWRNNSYNYGNVDRVELIERLLLEKLGVEGNQPPGTANAELTLNDIEEILAESATNHPTAHGTLPFFVDAVRGGDDQQLQAMTDELDAWREGGYSWRDDSGDGLADFAGQVIWEEAVAQLQDLLFGDHLSDIDRYDALVHVLDGTAKFDWVAEAGFDSDGAAIREAMRRAADTLEERFESADPSDWLKEADTSQYMGISAAGGETIPRMNRGSWNHLVAFRDEPREDLAQSVLPPSNSGHLSADEFAHVLAGEDRPERHTDQLGLYVNFEYKHLPVVGEDVDAVTENEETLVAGPSPKRELENRSTTTDDRFDVDDLPFESPEVADEAMDELNGD